MSEESQGSVPASRRTFLRGVGLGAGATALGAAVVAAGPLAAQASTTSTKPAGQGHDEQGHDDDPGLEGSLIAHVSDIAGGRIVLMLDGRETVVTDQALTRALARKAR